MPETDDMLILMEMGDLNPVCPSRRDAVLAACGPDGAEITVTYDEQDIGEFSGEDAHLVAVAALRERMDAAKFYPDVWYIDRAGITTNISERFVAATCAASTN